MMHRIIRALFSTLMLAFLALPARAEMQIQSVTSPGGITAWLVEEHQIPFVALEIRFKGGSSLEVPDEAGEISKRGAINLMTATLEEGAGDLNAQQFAEAREALAASYGFDVHDDALSVSARFLTENRTEAVALLRLALEKPRFDQDAIDRVRGQVASIIQSDAKDPEKIAGEVFNRMAFVGHPYSADQNGTLDSLTTLTRDDLLTAHSRVLARDRLYVSAVGDITPEELGKLLDDLLGWLPAEGAPMPGHVDFGLPGGVTVVDYDSPQSIAVFGHTGIKRDDPDFFAAYILNHVLGGPGFGSRLMNEVREKRGLTYGISTFLVPMDNAEFVSGSVASSNDKIAEAVRLVQEEWKRLAVEGITAEELQKAKTYLTGSYPLRFDGNGPIADILVGMQMQGLPIDYALTRNDQVNAVTLEDVKRVAQRLLLPEKLHFIVVGKPIGLETTHD